MLVLVLVLFHPYVPVPVHGVVVFIDWQSTPTIV